MKKFKLRIILILFLLITFVATISSASYSNITMSVVEEPICTINFGSNSSFEKKLYSKDLTNKDVTLQLKVTNNEEILKPTGEIMLVIDNSDSMISNTVSEGKTREDVVIDSAKTLITNLLEDNTKLKIGIVSFSTNLDITKEGSIEDAQMISELTNDSASLISSVSNIPFNGARTNLDAGITLAEQYFTDKTDKSHKYVIVLSDGVPNVAINYDKNYYSDDVISKTKSKLQALSNFADNVIIMLTGIEADMPAQTTNKTFGKIVEEIFGTTTNPTVGKFYYITDDYIEKTIKTDIYKDLQPVKQTLTNIKIVDYFPKEIVENFEFAYVEKASIGNISTKIDVSNNSITWNIPELKSGETAIVQYKLKLKEDYDENIVDKILNTNSKVDLTYTDSSDKTDTKSSDVTPKLKLVEPKPEVLPKAGKNIFYSFIGLVLVISIIFGTRYIVVKNKLK